MAPEMTHAVLLDVLRVAAFALALAVIIYAIVRVRTGLNWNSDGNVLVRPYGAPDGVVALLLMGLFGWLVLEAVDTPKQDMNMDAYAIGLFIGAMFPVLLCVVLVAYMSVMRRMNPAEMFGLRSLTPRQAFGRACLWLVGTVVFMTVGVALVYAGLLDGRLPDDSSQELVEMFRNSDSLLLRIVVVVAAVLIAPLTEEFLFRGFFYGVTKRYTERWFAVLFTAILFAAVHNHVGSLFPLFLLGIGFAVAYEATGSLLVPIFMHMMFNSLNILQILFLPAS